MERRKLGRRREAPGEGVERPHRVENLNKSNFFMEIPEVGDLDFENFTFSPSGSAEYRIDIGKPCKAAARVRIDSLHLKWPRLVAKSLVVVYNCVDFWPHFDVKTKAVSLGGVVYILVDEVARHAEEDAELVPLPRGPLWYQLAKIGSFALCRTIREILSIDADCKTYVSTS
ncbi:MAG: hypothetical protein QXD96_05200 [Pyrobaculum sp.]